MNRPEAIVDDLRAQLRQDLDHEALHHGVESGALQDRVMAQWRQRHPATETAWATAGVAPHGRGPGAARRRLWWSAGAVLVAALVISAVSWPSRSDPALEELMQMDVLTLMSMGAM